jgi:hypothetical protein
MMSAILKHIEPEMLITYLISALEEHGTVKVLEDLVQSLQWRAHDSFAAKLPDRLPIGTLEDFWQDHDTACHAFRLIREAVEALKSDCAERGAVSH